MCAETWKLKNQGKIFCFLAQGHLTTKEAVLSRYFWGKWLLLWDEYISQIYCQDVNPVTALAESFLLHFCWRARFEFSWPRIQIFCSLCSSKEIHSVISHCEIDLHSLHTKALCGSLEIISLTDFITNRTFIQERHNWHTMIRHYKAICSKKNSIYKLWEDYVNNLF